MSTKILQTFQIFFLSIVFTFGVLIAVQRNAYSAKRGYSDSSSSSSRSVGAQVMLMDVSAHYVRDMKPDGPTDTAARLSIGGLFSYWVGLDIQGHYHTKSKNYLLGVDIRLMPTEWLFLKGGVGAYAEKVTREFRSTPIAGGGLMARFDEVYLVSEATHFQVHGRNNISFGLGLGVIF